MRTGQIDGAPLGLELVSNFVRQALVLQSPALFNNYRQVDAARAELTPAMDKEAYENGFKVMGWGDVGRLRLMSKKPVRLLEDFKTVRPWLYPQSDTLKEFYKIIGATGVPLGVAEVYGALRTDMIDVVWTSALLGALLQWHSSCKYVTAQGMGFIQGAFVFRRGAWEGLGPKVQDSMWSLADEQRQKNQIEARKNDERAFLKLTSRGHEAIALENEEAWWEMGKNLRRRMIGRIYTKELVEQAEKISQANRDTDAAH
jgi:TRAP-type C4-dicarboxylate transport system substrate-binding protein